MLNLAILLEDSAREVPKRTAIVCEETRRSYAELNAATNQVANGLVQAGIRKGDTVALSCQDVPSFPIAYYGILKAGAVIMPLNVLLKPREIAYHLTDGDAKALFCQEGSPELPCVLRMGRNCHRPQASFLAPARTSVLYCSCAKAPCCVTKHSWHTGLSVSQGETARGLPAQAANWVPDDKVREYLAARVKQRIE